MTHSFDLTTALVADRQHTLREEAHHHRLGRIARRDRPRRGARRGVVAQLGSIDLAVTPLPAHTPVTGANPRERSAA